MSDQPTDRMAESENALKGLQMRPGWIHVWRQGPSTIKARRWDPNLRIWVLLPVAEWAAAMHVRLPVTQYLHDPDAPTWAPPHNPAHGGES